MNKLVVLLVLGCNKRKSKSRHPKGQPIASIIRKGVRYRVLYTQSRPKLGHDQSRRKTQEKTQKAAR